VLHHFVEDGVERGSVERFAAGEELVEDGAEGEDVRTAVDAETADLFGRHVVRRAEDRAGAGHVGLAEEGQAEVEDLHLHVRQDEDVRRLEIAVDDVRRVCEGDRVADLLHDLELRAQVGERVRRDESLQVVAVEQLHGHEEAAGVLAEVVDGDDVRMREPGRGLGLAAEALASLLVGRADDFQRDEAIEHLVVRAENLSHRAAADAVEKPVFADL
jgi:hypothetical protein